MPKKIDARNRSQVYREGGEVKEKSAWEVHKDIRGGKSKYYKSEAEFKKALDKPPMTPWERHLAVGGGKSKYFKSEAEFKEHGEKIGKNKGKK